ncbi:MAG: TPM domain-containing protein [Pseudomonadota bacterium]|jgi:uncharacterized membrane protein
MGRYLNNLVTGRWHARRLVKPGDELKIEEVVTEVERATSAEIKVVVEIALGFSDLRAKRTARERALEVFGLERMWDTDANNGVLLYLLIAERDAEIVADRGFNNLVTERQWRDICEKLEQDVAAIGFVPAVIATVRRIGELASAAYPAIDDRNQISNEVKIR